MTLVESRRLGWGVGSTRLVELSLRDSGEVTGENNLSITEGALLLFGADDDVDDDNDNVFFCDS